MAYNKVVARRGVAISIGEMTPYLSQPWPWYVAGPLIGLMFLVEHIWRMCVLPPHERPGIAAIVQAYRRESAQRGAGATRP